MNRTIYVVECFEKDWVPMYGMFGLMGFETMKIAKREFETIKVANHDEKLRIRKYKLERFRGLETPQDLKLREYPKGEAV